MNLFNNPREDELHSLIYMDELTGIYNRRALFKILRNFMSHDSDKNYKLALLMIDLDDFKQVNDKYGHLEGDYVLKSIGDILIKSVSSSDIPFRYAGDEFAVIMINPENDEPMELSNKITKNVNRTLYKTRKEEKELKLSVSVGVAEFPQDALELEEFIDMADKALYCSKKQGKNLASHVSSFQELSPRDEILKFSFPLSEYIGKSNELAIALDKISRIQSADPAFIMVQGDYGVGKTRFLAEIVKIADDFGIDTLFERCLNDSRIMPYSVLLSLLKKYFRQNILLFRKIEEQIENTEYNDILDLFKEDMTYNLENIDETDGAKKRKDIFRGIIYILKLITSEKPLIIMLDDFEYIDEGTIEIIRHILTEKQKINIGFYTAIHNESKRLKEILAKFDNIPGSSILHLQPFSIKEVKHIITSVFRNVDNIDEVASIFHSISQGKPLFVEEYLKWCLHNAKIHKDGDIWKFDVIEKDINPEELLKNRISSVDKETEKLISNASIIGPNFTIDILKDIMGLNEGEALDIIDKAVSERLITIDAFTDEEYFMFASKKVHNVTYDNVPEEERKNVHLEIANFIENLSTADDESAGNYARLAYHYEHGGELKKASQYAKKVNEVASTLFNLKEVDDYFSSDDDEIKPFISEFNSADIAKVVKFVKELAKVIKNIRLYPEGSKLITKGYNEIFRQLVKLLEKEEGLTLSVSQEIILINNNSIPKKMYDEGLSDLIKILSQHYIRHFSIIKGVVQDELLTAIQYLAKKPPKGFYPKEYWKKKIKDGNIQTIGIIQSEYKVSEDSNNKTTSLLNRISEMPEETVFNIKKMLTSLNGIIDNMKIYPTGSKIINENVDACYSFLINALEKVKVIQIGVYDQELLINGKSAYRGVFGKIVDDIIAVLNKAKLENIIFQLGVSSDEFEQFITLLFDEVNASSEEISSRGSQFLKAEFKNILTGDIKYYINETKGLSIGKGEERSSHDGQGSEVSQGEVIYDEEDDFVQTDDILETAEDWISFPSARLLNKDILVKFPTVYSYLIREQIRNTAKSIADKFSKNLLQKKEELRNIGINAHVDLLTQLPQDCLSEYFSASAENIIKFFMIQKKFTDETRNIAINLILVMISKREWKLAEKAVWTIFRYNFNDLKMDSNDYGYLRNIAAVVFAEADIKDILIKGVNVNEASSVYRIIEDLTPFIPQSIFGLIEEIKNPEQVKSIRKSLLNVPSAVLSEQVNKQITPSSSPDLILSLLNYVIVFDLDIKYPQLSIIISKSNKPIKKSLMAYLDIKSSEYLSELFDKAIKFDDKLTIIMLLEGLGNRAESSDVSAIEILLETSSDNDIKKECCIALGKMGNKSSSLILRNIVEKKGLFSLSNAQTDEIRATAIWALSEIKSDDDYEFLQKYIKDKSVAVRTAVKLGISKWTN